jgi:hypothetical protein
MLQINLRFKKAQQLTVANAFPAQDFIWTRRINDIIHHLFTIFVICFVSLEFRQ